MPIIRYFVVVGGVLIALLLAADRYFPAPVERTNATDLDRTTIRIRSARGLPEKIVFDTRPRADLAAVATGEPSGEPQSPAREALAAMPAGATPEAKKEPPTRRHAEARSQAKRWTKPARPSSERRLAFERHDFFAGGW